MDEEWIRCHLDAREGDSRGGVGADHQGDEGRPQVSKHVGELQRGTHELFTN